MTGNDSSNNDQARQDQFDRDYQRERDRGATHHEATEVALSLQKERDSRNDQNN
ncbi:hypothetical protein [Deinococcus multiflagellatus]|uniref:DUF3606 domain-containing protein n=1 Tax=Deinococcus multiflagellatus TaxID=1656887 RepID=A0ABW1ZT52_9DEIO|nr:hypothetical protein [Deinococcus multiflagellatus]MBZ9714409.1 hypothetical protein [Deinococcus multiflagellatus]